MAKTEEIAKVAMKPTAAPTRPIMVTRATPPLPRATVAMKPETPMTRATVVNRTNDANDKNNRGHEGNATTNKTNSGSERNDERNRGHECNDANDNNNGGDRGHTTSDESDTGDENKDDIDQNNSDDEANDTHVESNNGDMTRATKVIRARILGLRYVKLRIGKLGMSPSWFLKTQHSAASGCTAQEVPPDVRRRRSDTHERFSLKHHGDLRNRAISVFHVSAFYFSFFLHVFF